MTREQPYEDFTEAEYGRLLRLAKAGYRFIAFPEYRTASPPCVLWRHDLDFSVHRGLALARIEAEAGVRSTFFLNLHSRFYNALEPEVAERVREIVALGHDLGVHFDPSFYGARETSLEDALRREQELLEDTFECSVGSFSLHNPGPSPWSDDDELAGLVNAYGAYLRDHFGYCSDSHGYWRFQPLSQVLAAREHERLQVLTHPEWWVPEPMSPRERVSRCIDGRAAAQHARYEAVVAALDADAGGRSVSGSP